MATNITERSSTLPESSSKYMPPPVKQFCPKKERNWIKSRSFTGNKRTEEHVKTHIKLKALQQVTTCYNSASLWWCYQASIWYKHRSFPPGLFAIISILQDEGNQPSISMFMGVSTVLRQQNTASYRSGVADLRNIFFPSVTELSFTGKIIAQLSQEVAGPCS